MPTSELAFDETFAPDENRLGAEGAGETHLRRLLARIRFITAALANGIARAALDDAQTYAAERFLRDVRFTLIGGGTSEIVKLVIAKGLATEPEI